MGYKNSKNSRSASYSANVSINVLSKGFTIDRIKTKESINDILPKKNQFSYSYTHDIYSLNGLSVALVFMRRPFPTIVLSKISFERNKEYKSVVVPSFDREK